MNEITIESIFSELTARGTNPISRNGEIVSNCIFSNCDENRKDNELGHLYIAESSGAYYCHKCNAKGGPSLLLKELGLSGIRENATSDYQVYSDGLIFSVKEYLLQRGLTEKTISDTKLGYGKFYKDTYITIPVFDEYGEYKFMKLRRFPDEQSCKKYKNYPSRIAKTSLYGLNTLDVKEEYVVICEGEFDCLVLKQEGINAVTSTGGAMTFQEEWLKHLSEFKYVYLWLDSDDVGRQASKKLKDKILSRFSDKSVIEIEFSGELNGCKDITEVYLKGINLTEFLQRYRDQVESPPDLSVFEELTLSKLTNILELTIKQDNITKTLAFLSMLTAFSNDNQINLLFTAPSSTGKSYIPTELTRYFPEENLIILGYCSPMAFFHDNSVQLPDSDMKVLNLEHKIIVLLDAPHTELLARLRPILSHDKKEMLVKIADKVKGSNKTKNIIVRGFPVVVFCTANIDVDEQEQTRFLILSPEMSSEKIRQSIHGVLHRESDRNSYKNEIENNLEWKSLKERVRAVKDSGVINVLYDEFQFESIIMEQLSTQRLQPRDQREVKRIIDCIKSYAMLNFMHRDRVNENTITAKTTDALEVLSLWKDVLATQRLGISPYEYEIYNLVLAPLRKNASDTVTSFSFKEINDYFYSIYQKPMDGLTFKRKMVPKYENAGLIEMVSDTDDKRVRRYVIKNINVLEGGEILQSLAEVVE